MPALTTTDIFALVSRLNDEYQPCAQKDENGVCQVPGPCVATPRRVKLLIDELKAYTGEVQAARHRHEALGIAAIAMGPAAIPLTDLLGGGNVDVAQWRSDMTNWQFRLAEYDRMLTQFMAEHPSAVDTPAGCEAIYRDITSPLLDGIWYRVMPGVVLSTEEKQRIAQGGASNRKPNDVITPWSLGNQIIVYQDFQKENAERFFQELIDRARKIAEDIADPGRWPWWLKGAIIVGAGVGVGMLGLYVYQFLPKPPAKNPRRKLRPKQSSAT